MIIIAPLDLASTLSSEYLPTPLYKYMHVLYTYEKTCIDIVWHYVNVLDNTTACMQCAGFVLMCMCLLTLSCMATQYYIMYCISIHIKPE